MAIGFFQIVVANLVLPLHELRLDVEWGEINCDACPSIVNIV